MSFSSFQIQQPDLGKIGVTLERDELNPMGHCFCPDGVCPDPEGWCSKLVKMQKMFAEACQNTTTLSPSCQTLCDRSTFESMEKFVFVTIMQTFGASLLQYPSLQNHPITNEITSFLFNQKYLEIPQPRQTLQHLRSLWAKHSGEHCVVNTIDELKATLNSRITQHRAKGYGFWDFLSKVGGKTIEEMIRIDEQLEMEKQSSQK